MKGNENESYHQMRVGYRGVLGLQVLCRLVARRRYGELWRRNLRSAYPRFGGVVPVNGQSPVGTGIGIEKEVRK